MKGEGRREKSEERRAKDERREGGREEWEEIKISF